VSTHKSASLIHAFRGTVIAILVAIPAGFAQVVTYPAPTGLVTSTDFTLQVNGQAVWVENLFSGYVNAANFSCAGPVTIKVTASENITKFIIRPKSRGIIGQVSGRDLTFSLPGPQKVYVEVNGLTHLVIFANPLEVNPPQQGNANVTYYGPGAANPGTITLQNNQTVYIAGGASVTASISGTNVRNARIIGRGFLNGHIRLTGCSNIEIDGVFVRSNGGWVVVPTNCDSVTIRNVKVISPPGGGDGMDLCASRFVRVVDCFVRAGDDCITVKSLSTGVTLIDSITVSGCIMVGWGTSDGFTMGYEELSALEQNILVKDCDILYSTTGGHSAFSIICDGRAWIKHVRFEDIRAEENITAPFGNFNLMVTDAQQWVHDVPGHIQGVYLKNCSWENGNNHLQLQGYGPNNLVDSVTFDHCTVGGKLLKSFADATWHNNQYIKNIRFIDTPTEAQLPAARQAAIPGEWMRAGVNGGVLRISIDRPGRYSLDITDLSGALVGRFAGVNAGSFVLPASQLKPGAYVVRLRTSAGVMSRTVAAW